MSTTQFAAADTASIDVPTELAGTDSKLVYLFLAATDGATIDELHDGLGVRKLSLFPVLRTLTERGVVARNGATYVPNAS